MTDLWPGEFRFCPMCSAPLAAVERGGRQRMGCSVCGYVHFRDPGVGAAVLLTRPPPEKGRRGPTVRDDDAEVLLVKRGETATRSGMWCVPCGYVDYGEEIRAAAAREVREETGLDVQVGEPIFVRSNFHDPEKLTVGIWFTGEIIGGELRPGDDAVDARWFPLTDLPVLAFDTDAELFGSRFGVDTIVGD